MVALSYQSMVNLARKASEGGARRISMTRLEWDVAGDCMKPVGVEFWSRPAADDPARARKRLRKAQKAFWGREFDRLVRNTPVRYSWEKPLRGKVDNSKYISVGPKDGPGLLTVQMDVRCRKCATCKKQRSRMWYQRAVNETLSAHRTWFGTITLHPDAHQQALARARVKARKTGVDWDELDPDAQFTRVHAQIGVHLQLWLKRVRKNSGAPLRFFLVCERHKSGLPHYHCLVHETDEMRPVRKDHLRSAWSLGFTKFKLVKEAKQAGYLCKYLSKSALARVRASSRYGQTSSRHSENVLQVSVSKETNNGAKRSLATMTPCDANVSEANASVDQQGSTQKGTM